MINTLRGSSVSRGASALDLDRVSKVFPDGTHALDNVSFALDRGEFVAVVGPSGCGKSTILRIASGLLPLSGGSYSLADENLGYVFQDPTLLPWRTVQKNVELFTELRDIPKPEREALARDAIELVGLEGFEGHHPRRLSGGMKMRVSLARSLTLSPGLFLFDEPFAALDEITRATMADEVLRLFVSVGFGSLFITHNLYEAVYLATRVLVMSERPGRIVAEFEVPFDYPRTQDLRFDPAFVRLLRDVSMAIRGDAADPGSPVVAHVLEDRPSTAGGEGGRTATPSGPDMVDLVAGLSEAELDRLYSLVANDDTLGAAVGLSGGTTTPEFDVPEPPAETDSTEAKVEPGLEATDTEIEAVPGPAPRLKRARRSVGTIVGPLIVFMLFLGVWYFFTYVLLTERRRFLMPPPHAVVQEGFLTWDNHSEILRGLWSTTQVTLWGFGIAIVLGMGLATLMSQARWVEISLYPYAVIIQTVPIIALVPLIGLWFDWSFRARVINCVIIAIFPLITNTLFGLKSADAAHHDLFTLHGAGRGRRLRKLQYPTAQPAIYTGLRISAGLAVIGGIVGDFFFRKGEPGIGRLLDVYRQTVQTEMLYAAVVWSCLLGIVMFWSVGFLGDLAIRNWHDSAITKEQ